MVFRATGADGVASLYQLVRASRRVLLNLTLYHVVVL